MMARICSRERARKRRSSCSNIMARYRRSILKGSRSLFPRPKQQLENEVAEKIRPRASWAQVLATATQAGLLGVALYGLFISDVGARLTELLQGDIEQAEADLQLLERAKSETELQLRTEKQELERARIDSLTTQIELTAQSSDLARAEDLVLSASALLEENNLKLTQLDEALSVARPALIDQRCSALGSSLSAPTALEMRYRLIPQYRWQRFAEKARSRDYENWATLHAAFSSWTDASYQEDQVIEATFTRADQRILSEIRDQEHWAQFTGKREREILSGFRIEAPREFTPRISEYLSNVRNYDEFLTLALRQDERIDGIQRLLQAESMEQTDKKYQQFKSLLRNAIEPHLRSYSLYVGEEEAMQAQTVDEVRQAVAKHFAYQSNARVARKKLADICYPNDQLKRLFLNVD